MFDNYWIADEQMVTASYSTSRALFFHNPCKLWLSSDHASALCTQVASKGPTAPALSSHWGVRESLHPHLFLFTAQGNTQHAKDTLTFEDKTTFSEISYYSLLSFLKSGAVQAYSSH